MTTDHFILQLAHLANAVTIGLGRDAAKAEKWFRAPNPMLGGTSAMEMILKGRIHRLQVFIESALQASGEDPDRVNLASLEHSESADSPGPGGHLCDSVESHGTALHPRESADSPGTGCHPSESTDSPGTGCHRSESTDSPDVGLHPGDSVESPGTSPARAATRTVEAIAEKIAGGFIHHLAPSFSTPARLVCPSDAAELVVVDAVTRAATVRGISVEVIDLRPAPVERLCAITERLDGWQRGATDSGPGQVPTLLILRGFDAFGDDTHDGPTYPFRSKFQFDRKFLWLFVGQDASRMRFLFDSHQRPLYRAAGEITPEDWLYEKRVLHR
ncbi:antitoxin Xre/MbcA/ParS toxin-binding domain-containing protein [Dyella jiangningensis]